MVYDFQNNNEGEEAEVVKTFISVEELIEELNSQF